MSSNFVSRSRRSTKPTHDWTARQTTDDNFRKSPVRDANVTKTPGDHCCPGEERVGRRYGGPTKSLCHRQGDTASDHELYKLSEEKSSDEGSATEIDTNDSSHGDVHPTCHQCDSCPKKYDNSWREYSPCVYGKYAASHRPLKTENLVVDTAGNAEPGVICQSPITPNRYQRNPRNYANPVNLPQALVAMKKLERLKELQRRRDYSERFYSQEIRRLIGENFFAENAAVVTAPVKNKTGRVSSPVPRTNDDGQNGSDQRNRGGGYSKEPEPYGTMTTITRLNCGCVEETTIPIFNSSVGHVKKCDNHRYQERPVSSKMPTPHSKEISYEVDENTGKFEHLVNQYPPPKARGKHLVDCGPYRNLSNTVSRDLESWDDRKVQSRNRRSPRNSSPVRTNSPARKYSNTSTNE